MRSALVMGLSGLAMLGLAACQKSSNSGSSAGNTAAPAAAPAGPVAMDGPPHRKAGLWKQTLSGTGIPASAPTMELCVDDATEAKFSPTGSSLDKDHCPQHSFTRNLDGSMSFSYTCPVGEGGGQTVTQGTITGSFDSGYQMSIDMVTTGAANAEANGEHKITMTGQWMGPCPAGEKGGDMTMVMPNGQVMRMPSGMGGLHPPSPQG